MGHPRKRKFRPRKALLTVNDAHQTEAVWPLHICLSQALFVSQQSAACSRCSFDKLNHSFLWLSTGFFFFSFPSWWLNLPSGYTSFWKVLLVTDLFVLAQKSAAYMSLIASPVGVYSPHIPWNIHLLLIFLHTWVKPAKCNQMSLISYVKFTEVDLSSLAVEV